jgi:hypothetical protein
MFREVPVRRLGPTNTAETSLFARRAVEFCLTAIRDRATTPAADEAR